MMMRSPVKGMAAGKPGVGKFSTSGSHSASASKPTLWRGKKRQKRGFGFYGTDRACGGYLI
jgi:hypothetical protein